MTTDFNTAVLIDLFVRFAINLGAMLFLVFGMYYRRYHDKELVTTAALFNVFVFGVLTILSSVEFGLAAGFGLFAILALFNLRSEQISKTEITYFFGSVSIAVICSIQGSAYALIVIIMLLILLSAYVIDHTGVLRSVSAIKVTLDAIDPKLLSSPEKMHAELSERLSVDVMSFQTIEIDYITDMARLTVYYRERS